MSCSVVCIAPEKLKLLKEITSIYEESIQYAAQFDPEPTGAELGKMYEVSEGTDKYLSAVEDTLIKVVAKIFDLSEKDIRNVFCPQPSIGEKFTYMPSGDTIYVKILELLAKN